MNKWLKTITLYKGLAFGNYNPVIKLFPQIHSHRYVLILRAKGKIIFFSPNLVSGFLKKDKGTFYHPGKVASVKQIKCLIRPNYLML